MNNGSRYQRNLEALSKTDPDSYDWLVAGRSEGLIIEGENIWVEKEGRKKSAYYEATPSIAQEKELIKPLNLSNGCLTCLIGMGLGYTTMAILESMENSHRLMVLDPNTQIIKSAFERFDFSKQLHSRKLFVVRPERVSIRKRLMQLISGGYTHQDVNIIPDPRSVALFSHYKDLVQDVKVAFYDGTTVLSGPFKAEKYMVLNELENIVPAMLSPGLGHLKKIIKGRPILIIGAGPSLKSAIPWISRLREKMVLLALPASWRHLLANGIKPHLLVSSDKNIESLGMLKGTSHAHDIPLVFSSRVHPEFLNAYTGPVIAVPHPGPLHSWLGACRGEEQAVQTGISVAQFAFELACLFKGNPIVLTGMDLAVDGFSHAEGHPMRIKIPKEVLIPTRGVRGSQVNTLKGYFTIKESLEQVISKRRVRVINATHKGAQILGTEESTLEEMDRFLGPMKPLSDFEFPCLPPELQGEQVSTVLIPKLSGFVMDCERAIECCRKGIGFSEKLVNAQGTNRDLIMEQTNRNTAEVESLIQYHPFLKSYFGEALYQAKIDNARIASESNADRRFKKEVEKNTKALHAFAIAIDSLMDLIKSKIEDLKELDHLLSTYQKKETAGDLLPLVDFLLKTRLCHQANMAIESIFSMDRDSMDVLQLLGKIRIKQGRYWEAKEYVEVAVQAGGRNWKREELLKDMETGKNDLLNMKQEAIKSKDDVSMVLASKDLAYADRRGSIPNLSLQQ